MNSMKTITITASSLSELEEKLYTDYELTPTSRDWRAKLRRYQHTEFDYHGTDFVLISDFGNNRYGLTEL